MRIEIVKIYDDFLKLKPLWNQLLEESTNDNVYLRHEWFQCWWRAFGKDRVLFIVLVAEGDTLCGIAPLTISKTKFRGFPVRTVEFMANKDSPRCDFILGKSDKFVLEKIISTVLKSDRDWDLFCLKNLSVDSKNFTWLQDVLCATSRKCLILPGLTSPFISVAGDWKSYQRELSRKTKKTLRNIVNRTDKAGDIKIEQLSNLDQIKNIETVSRNSWKFREGKSFAENQERSLFFRLLTEQGVEQDWISLWCMFKGNVPIAYEYHLRYKGKEIALLADYDDSYANFSPGSILDYRILSSLFGEGIMEYDLCGSNDSYKSKWNPNLRQHKAIYVFKDALYSNLLYYLEAKAVPGIKSLRNRII